MAEEESGGSESTVTDPQLNPTVVEGSRIERFAQSRAVWSRPRAQLRI